VPYIPYLADINIFSSEITFSTNSSVCFLISEPSTDKDTRPPKHNQKNIFNASLQSPCLSAGFPLCGKKLVNSMSLSFLNIVGPLISAFLISDLALWLKVTLKYALYFLKKFQTVLSV
jgi:hypothetical protein